MNPNLAHRFKVFVDDEEVNYVQSVTYNSRGNNQLDSLDVRISGSLSASKNYFGKPMTFFLDSNDGVPIFRDSNHLNIESARLLARKHLAL